VDSQEQSHALNRDLELPFQLLCDTGKKTTNLYQLLNPHEHGGIAYPAIFLIKKDGVIGYRSLDRTAQRVNLSEILEYLKELAQNPDHQMKSTSSKGLIIPSVGSWLQIGKNMVMRGSLADWKHYILYPLFLARYLLGIARRPDDKK
jgi:AhpC/TSA family protein